MKTEIKLLIEKQRSGDNLCTDEIRTLMLYALVLLKEFEQLTLGSIARSNKLLGKQ